MAENPILSFFAPDLTLVFDLGKYTSLRWRAKYFEPGEFELHTSPDYFGLVKYGQIVLRDDRKDGAVVEGIQVQTGDLVITGRFLAAKLADAGVRDVYNINGTIEAAMRKMVAEQYGRTQRTLSIKLPQAGEYTPTIQAQISRKNLLTVTEALARAGGLGYRVFADVDARCLYFEVYNGVDRTVRQEENNRVVFSDGVDDDGYNNVDDPKYTENYTNAKNYALVYGEGEGDTRICVEVDETNGADRRELLVDARDLQQGDQSAAEYRAALAQRGRDKLKENQPTAALETGIKSTSQFAYMVDWQLGDIVTGQITAWGMETDQRITEVEEVYESNALTVTPTLGTPAPEAYNLEDTIA